MSTKVPSVVHPYPPVPGSPSGVGTFFPAHPFGVQSSSPLLVGLEHYWTLDEQSGTRNDSVGTEHLTDNNTVGYVAGKNGNAASFVSANLESLSVASLPFLTDWTVSGWVYGNADHSYLGTWGTISYPNYRFALNTLAGKARAQVVGTDAPYADSADALAAASWNHIVASYDSSTKKAAISINGGTPVLTTAVVGTLYSASTLWTVGRGNNGYSNANMDELAIWSRVLTADERTTLYNAGTGKFYPSF